MKIPSLRVELFRADRQTDRQTDMTKLRVPFHNFANAPKKNAQHSLPLASREEINLRYKTHDW